MKRVAFTSLLGFCVLFSSDASAQNVNLTDPDAAGASFVACWHSGDKHVRTTISLDSSKAVEGALECSGKSLDVGTISTSYRGGFTGNPYEMKLAVDWKFVCKPRGGGALGRRTEKWSRITNVKDDYPPDACSLQNWRIIETDLFPNDKRQ